MIRDAFFIVLLMGLSAPTQAQEQPSDHTSPDDGPVNAAVTATTADHGKFDTLKGPFESGSDVTRACLSCHTEAGRQVAQSIHWTWETNNPATGQTLGKRHVLNAFCGNLATNEPRCTSCHAGYGWEETASFDFTDETRIDCLACHDTTGEYVKWPTEAGHPLYEPRTQASRMVPYADALIVEEPNGGLTHLPPDLSRVAANVGRPTRENCGNCHFYGGGGDNVKHGDLSSALVDPSPHVDVHMSPNGANMVCVDCHMGNRHAWPGSRYHGTISDTTHQRPGMRNTDILACNSCHTTTPHKALSLKGNKLNDHTDRVACQTCHIPAFAKTTPTKVFWDWSTAGQDIKPGKDEHGRPTYNKKKGSFKWAKGARPEYRWYNGTVERHILGDRINTEGVTELTRPVGAIGDASARIYPFKVHRGKQPADAVHNYLLAPKLWKGFWKHWDWDKAAREGMKAAGLEYSGQYKFVETAMYWGLTHEVAPKEQSLSCAACHGSLNQAPHCGRCHKDTEGIDFKEMATRGQGAGSDYLDFKAMGISGDPVETGGRFADLPLKASGPNGRTASAAKK